MDRLAWFDVDEEHYGGGLPVDVSAARERARSHDTDDIGLPLCRTIKDTALLLAWSNRRANRNEVIAVRADALDEIKGQIEVPRLALDWIGVDVVAAGLGSLLLVAYYRPDLFSGWPERFGGSGLAASRLQAEEFTAVYRRLADYGSVEDLDESLGAPMVIDVARVDLPVRPGVDRSRLV
ncbi:MAG: hypothetical protein IPI92_19280 [Gemmatimonadetes bacterium]|nr:hypothetical protein [Gemmatimonadota bacterium]MBK7351999.1 hypothetical protein [Gemmatimonadota bacterium]